MPRLMLAPYSCPGTHTIDTDSGCAQTKASAPAVCSIRDSEKCGWWQVTQLFSSYVVSSLQQYAQDPARNWRAKDTAVYLVVALTVQGRTRAQETTATNQLVNVLDFFGSVRAACCWLQAPMQCAAEGLKVPALDSMQLGGVCGVHQSHASQVRRQPRWGL